jgi:HEAT repeat protein
MRAAAVLVLLAASLAAGDGVDRHPFEGAVRVANRTYEVETNTFPELARSLAASLEESYALFEDRFGPLEGAARRPMRVALYRTHDEYLTLGGGVRGAVGHFDSGLDQCAFAWSGATGEAGWPIAVHEACHHYLRRKHPDASPPSWYSEGIACWFEGLGDPTTERAVSRVRIRAAKAALAAGEARLGAVLHTRARVAEGRILLHDFAPTRYYALAWSLVHLLATDDAYRSGFRRFELRLFASRPPAAERQSHALRLLEEECGDLRALEERWLAHLAALPEPAPAPAAPVYAWELESVRPFVRYAALRRLSTSGLEPDLRAAAVRCLLDGDLVVRGAACELLAGRMAEDCVPGLVACLDLGDADLRRASLRALAHPCASEAVPRLLAEAEDKDLALDALAAIGDPRGFRAMRAAVANRFVRLGTRARCASALAADEDGLETLLQAAADSDATLRTAARAALIRREGGGMVGRLVRVLEDPAAPAESKIEACGLLAATGAEEAVPVLRRLCRPGTPERVRLEAIRTLVRITGDTKGFEAGQGEHDREAALRAWGD